MIRPVILATVALGLSACTVGRDYTPAQNSILSQWFSAPSKNVSTADIKLEWWSVFNDPLLTKYITKAAQNNKNVQVALANTKHARALRDERGAAFLPQIGAGGGSERRKNSAAAANFNGGDIRNLYDAGFDASWEIDLFGGNRRAVEASNARVGSAVAEYGDVMLSTLSDVARNYYEARGLQKRIAITQANTKTLQETLKVVDTRLAVGEASAFDAARARGEYQLTNARLPNLKADLQASIFTLSVLLGEPPEALLSEMEIVKPLPTPPDIVPVGLRSDILRRRPDIRIAERELAASVADIGVETANLFPKFFVTGDIGSQARVFGDLFSAAGGMWSIGSLVQWSVFDGGAIRARIDAQEAESEAALATYEGTVLNALADTEAALTRYGQELETRKRLSEGVQSRRQATRFAKELYDAGEEDYLSVLDAERDLIAAEDDLVVSETNTITKLIALYTALGGGWDTQSLLSAHSEK